MNGPHLLRRVLVGRRGGIGLARCKKDLPCELREFSGGPAGLDELAQSFPLVKGAEIAADLLEVWGLSFGRWR